RRQLRERRGARGRWRLDRILSAPRRRGRPRLRGAPRRAMTPLFVWPGLAEDESLRERVVRIEPELAAARDPGTALDLGDDRGVRTEGRLARDAAGEAGADDALDHEWLPDRQAAARVLERDAPRDAGAGGRAVDLAVREHADVARISAGAERRAGEDRAVQEGQRRLERVRDLARGHDGFLDAPARVDQPAVVRGGH